jgi:hypothetical protein
VGIRWRPAEVAAAARAPARWAHGVDNARALEVPWALGERAEQSAGGEG